MVISRKRSGCCERGFDPEKERIGGEHAYIELSRLRQANGRDEIRGARDYQPGLRTDPQKRWSDWPGAAEPTGDGAIADVWQYSQRRPYWVRQY